MEEFARQKAEEEAILRAAQEEREYKDRMQHKPTTEDLARLQERVNKFTNKTELNNNTTTNNYDNDNGNGNSNSTVVVMVMVMMMMMMMIISFHTARDWKSLSLDTRNCTTIA